MSDNKEKFKSETDQISVYAFRIESLEQLTRFQSTEIESLKAITELAVTCLQRIDSIRETFPISFQPHHVEAAFIKAERLTTDTLSEIERLQNE